MSNKKIHDRLYLDRIDKRITIYKLYTCYGTIYNPSLNRVITHTPAVYNATAYAHSWGDSYWVPTSRDEYPDMRLSRLPQVDYVVSKQSWVGRLLQRPNFELTQLMFFMNRLKQPGGQAFLSSDPAPLGANLLNWTEPILGRFPIDRAGDWRGVCVYTRVCDIVILSFVPGLLSTFE